MKIKRDLVYTALLDANLVEGEDGIEIRGNYVGRGMYGKACFGVEFDVESHSYLLLVALAFAMAAADEENGEENARALAENAATDSMGTGMILYFPDWSLED